jgi:hypothetical protein
MSHPRRFFGFLSPSKCYHGSQSCPVLRHVVKVGKSDVRAYDSEEVATSKGHVRRCRLCLGKKVFDIKDSDRVRLTSGQYDALSIIVDIFKTKGGMTLRDIASRRHRSVVATYLIVKKLREIRLVEHTLERGRQRANGNSIIPTSRGISVIRATAVDDTPVVAKA